MIVLFIGLVAWVWYGMSRVQGCGDELLFETSSPEGHYVIGVFEGNCGATTGYMTHVNIRDGAKSFERNDYGLVNKGQLCVYNGRAEFQVKWSSANILDIAVDQPPDQVKCVKRVGATTILLRRMQNSTNSMRLN